MGAGWRRVVVDSWERRGPLALFFWPLARLTGLLVRVRRAMYRWGMLPIHRMPVPVIVVGNVIAGGSGKTPVVIEVVRHLLSCGWHPGVVSRGYGRRATGGAHVEPGSKVDDVGDEPLLIHRLTGVPVYVDAARVSAAQALLAAHRSIDVLVCDDGLQHYALHRDIEVCVFDHRGIGNGWLLPAGPLREPWPRPCDLALAAGAVTGIAAFSVERELATTGSTRDGTPVVLASLLAPAKQASAALWAVAGIAQPDQFFAMLRGAGIRLAGAIALPDHAAITAIQLAPAINSTLLCTEKDAEKVWRWRPDAIAVPLQLSIEPKFWLELDRLLTIRRVPKLSSGNGHSTD